MVYLDLTRLWSEFCLCSHPMAHSGCWQLSAWGPCLLAACWLAAASVPCLMNLPIQPFISSKSVAVSRMSEVKVAQLCPTLCDPIGYTVHGILQARILEWVASFSLLQGIFPTQGSNPGFPHCRRILYQLSHKGSHKGTDITGPISIS